MQRFTIVSEVVCWHSLTCIHDFSPVATAERRRLLSLFTERFGAVRIEDCCAATLIGFITEQRGCRSNHTRKRIRATICRPFNAAVAAGLLDRNPFAGIKIPCGRDGRDWTKAEFASALRSAAPHIRRFLTFLRFSGARPGEARTLQWSDLRDEAGCIVIRSHKTAHLSEIPRRIHYNDILFPLIRWLRRHRVHDRFVFANAHGKPWSISALTKYLRELRRRADLPADCRYHGLRHTFATNAIIHGVGIKAVADLLGHATVRTTERYIHMIDKRDWLNDAANKAIGR